MLHKNSAPGNIHTLVNWEVADSAALVALVLDGSDIYKLAFQLDTSEIKMLTNDIGPVWQTVANAAAFQPLDAQLTSLASLSYATNATKVIRVNAMETGFELATITAVTDHALLSNIGVNSHDDIDTMLSALASGKQNADAQLTDLAALSYAGNSLRVVRVNAGETAFELATVSGGGGLTNFTETLSTASPNNTVNTANLSVTGGTTNTDLVLQPRGTGAFLLDIPDNLAAGGNKRGTLAVDLQIERNANTQVASGSNSFIGAGGRNTAGGLYSGIVGGFNNSVSGQRSATLGGDSHSLTGSWGAIAGGSSNTVSGNLSGILAGSSNTCNADNAVVLGGSGNRSNGFGSVAMGHNASTKLGQATLAHSSSFFAAEGDAQYRRQIVRRATTDATPVNPSTNGAAASASTVLTLSDNSLVAFEGTAVVRQNTTGDAKAFHFTGAIKRGANAAATALVGVPTVTVLGNDAGAAAWTLSFAANTTLGSLVGVCTGEAAKNLRWVVTIKATEVTG